LYVGKRTDTFTMRQKHLKKHKPERSSLGHVFPGCKNLRRISLSNSNLSVSNIRILEELNSMYNVHELMKKEDTKYFKECLTMKGITRISGLDVYQVTYYIYTENM